MKTYIFIIVILSISTIAIAQRPDDYHEQLDGLINKTVPLIRAGELSSEMEQDDGIYLLDTREKEEYNVSHIAGADCVGYDNFRMRSVKDIPRDATVVVYCSLGVRSEKVGEKLTEAGFTDVRNLYGGIFEWVHEEQPVISKKGDTTRKVHAFNEEWSRWLYKGEKVY